MPDEVLALARRFIAPGTVVIEIGAGFGRMTALFSGLTGPAGQVLAFEADEYSCDVLRQTITFNRCENVRVFCGAVYDGSRTRVGFPALAAATDAAYSGQRIDPTEVSGRFQTRTVDELRIEGQIGFMYIDTNGCELNVLRGAEATITRLRMPIALRFDPTLAKIFGATTGDLTAFFDKIGYTATERHAERLWVALPRAMPVDASASSPASVDDFVRPSIHAPGGAWASHMCKLLQHRTQVDACTQYLKQFGYVPHALECKNWDIAHLLAAVGDGNFLDMGSSESYILTNLARKRIRGDLYGIDLRPPDVPVSAVNYLVGNLMQTPFPAGHFANIACLSVLEHQVEYDKFAAEAARLLAPNGHLFVTFDYWEPKITPPIKLYGLEWRPLDAAMVSRFIVSCEKQGLDIIQPFDFSADVPVIEWGYYSPHPDVSYTFGMAVFRKR